MFASQRPTSTSQYLEEGGKELLLHRLQSGSLSLTSKATMAPLGGCLRLLMFFFNSGIFALPYTKQLLGVYGVERHGLHF
jgi:hypothetical protein